MMKEELERLIDTHGLPNVMAAIADVCFEKAEHIRANWQDQFLSNRWENIGKSCGVSSRVWKDVLP